MLTLLTAAAAFVAVSSLVIWIASERRSPAEARLSRLSAAPRAPVPMDAPFTQRLVVPVLDSVAGFFVQLLPTAFVARTSRSLTVAGQPMSTQAFFTVLLLTAVLLPLSALTFVGLDTGEISLLAVGLAALLAMFGLAAPLVWLHQRVRMRKLTIWKSLADAFDLVTVCVEAGLGLDAALRQVSEKLRGPLAEEIQQTLREVGMGRARREALEDLAARADVRELTTFVNAVIQAEQLGTSLGRVLRAQAHSLRVHRRQRAEEVSRKAPVKMVFPLVFFIMPTFFLVTLGPIAVHFINYLTS